MNLTSRDQLRIDILSKYIDGTMRRKHAQESLELGERQFRRLVKRFKKEGFFSLKHGNCGKIPKNKTRQEIENKIVSLASEKFKGFNMTHFREKFMEEFSSTITPSYSTVRRIFTENKLYKPQKKRFKRPHKSRNRYEREGIMTQIDGSHHVWFGSQKTCLIVAVDDATGKILGAKFSKTETTFDTMDVIEQILLNHGMFHILYSDKAGIYDNHKRSGFTNVTRAMKQLDIACILSHSAEARGRVERLHRTLQDRLISELRLRNIGTIEEANAFLPEFIKYFNQRFAVIPADPKSAFRVLSENIKLNEILCTIEERIIGTGHTINLDNEKYVITSEPGFAIKRRPVEIKTYRDGSVKFFIEDIELQVRRLEKVKRAA
jgi:transposase